MRTNHVPRKDRLLSHLHKLEYRLEDNHVRSPNKGNPYYCCAQCGIHDPARSIQDGRHFKGCPLQGLEKEIDHLKRLVEEERG